MPISAFETLKLLFFSRPSNIAEPAELFTASRVVGSRCRFGWFARRDLRARKAPRSDFAIPGFTGALTPHFLRCVLPYTSICACTAIAKNTHFWTTDRHNIEITTWELFRLPQP